MAHEQNEFDFGEVRRLRVTQALLAGAGRVRCAVPLSDTDLLMLFCMRELAQNIADELAGLPFGEVQAQISLRMTSILGALDGVSEPFALETARYLTETVYRLTQQSVLPRLG